MPADMKDQVDPDERKWDAWKVTNLSQGLEMPCISIKTGTQELSLPSTARKLLFGRNIVLWTRETTRMEAITISEKARVKIDVRTL